MNLFLQVEVSFLMVGHTHEAVDRFFSFMNRCLKDNSTVMTPVEMHALLSEYMSTGEKIECRDLEFVADWKSWMNGCFEPLHDHTAKGSAHHWRFQRDAEDQPVVLRMKHHVSDEQWFPLDGLQLIKKDPEGTPNPAQYYPLGRMEPEKYITRLSKTVELLQKYDYVDAEQLAWWQKFLTDQKEFNKSGKVPEQYSESSAFRMDFPVRGDLDVSEARAREESTKSVDLTEADRRRFGAVQQKEAYTGKLQSRKRRNDRAADAELDLSEGSFAMLLNDVPEEPLLFGKVTEVDREHKVFKIWYYGRSDITGYKIDGSFTPLYNGLRGKKQKTTPWIGEAHFDTILNFDIQTKKASKKQKLVKITKRGQDSCLEAIQNCHQLRLQADEDPSDHDDGEADEESFRRKDYAGEEEMDGSDEDFDGG